MGDGDAAEERRRISFRVQGHDWEAVEAWRGRSGHVLVYFFPGDRRAVLSPGSDLGSLTPERLAELVASATPLTATERRISGKEGRRWLAQATGPVWAEGESAAAGLGGYVFSSLDGPFERLWSTGQSGAEDEPSLQRLLSSLQASDS